MSAKAELTRATQLLQSGQLKSALKTSKAGLRRYPKEPGFAHIAGLALVNGGNPREGAQYFAKALRLAPGDAAGQDNLVMALVQSGQLDKAEALIAKLLPRRTQKGPLYYQLGVLNMQRGAPDTAVAAASDAIAADREVMDAQGGIQPGQGPAVARAYALRAVAYEAAGDDEAAFGDYQTALEFDPDNPDTLSNVSLQLSRRMRTKEAFAALEKALQIRPRHLNALQRYGIQLNEAGRKSEAIDVLQMALEVDPANSDILRELARIQSAEGAQALRPRLETAFAKARKSSLDRARLAFGLAHCAEKAGDQEEAVRWYGSANRQAAALRPFDAERARSEEAAIEALFPEAGALPEAAAADGPRPIFVVGQPRSGTTLTELVLSAHPAIVGAGEQAIAGRFSHRHIAGGAPWDAAAAQGFAEAYRAALPGQEAAPLGVVDKMPANYKYLGFILTALPDAVIVNATRDPRDVAWSMWRNWFPNEPMNYAFDMRAMAAEANAYARYIARWKTLFPGRIHDVSYEDLVADIDGTSKRLAEICRVDWVPEMAAPEKNRSVVRTASVNQVREGIHTRSVGGWASHAEQLAPFVDGLDPKLWPGIG